MTCTASYSTASGYETRLLAQYLTALYQSAGHLAPAEASGAVEAAFVLAHGAQDGRGELNPEQQKAASQPLRQMAMTYIDRHLAQPDMTPETIAAAMQHLPLDPLRAVRGARRHQERRRRAPP